GAVQGGIQGHARQLPEKSLLQAAAAGTHPRGGACSLALAGPAEKEKEELTAAHSAADSTAGPDLALRRGPKRVRITLAQDRVPSTTIDDAASTKKLCAFAPCVVSH